MSETRRAWTPEKVAALIDALEEMNVNIEDLVAAEQHVGDILEKALSAPKNGEAEEATE